MNCNTNSNGHDISSLPFISTINTKSLQIVAGGGDDVARVENSLQAASSKPTARVARTRKPTGTLSKQNILAGPSIYLVDPSAQTQENYTGLLKGKILSCPRIPKGSDKETVPQYTLKWYSSVMDKNEKLNESQLRSTFPKGTTYRNQLLNAKNAYDLAEAHAQSKPSASSSSASNAVCAPKTKKRGPISPSTKRRKKKKQVSATDQRKLNQLKTTPIRISENQSFTAHISKKSSQPPSFTTEADREMTMYEWSINPELWIENRFKELRATNDSNLLSPCAEERLGDDELSCDSNLSSDNDEDPVFQMTDTDNSHPPPPPRHEFDEFPDHKAQDAVPDPISQNLEDDSRFPELPFKWKEWEDGDEIEPEPGHMAPEEFEFRDTFDKKRPSKIHTEQIIPSPSGELSHLYFWYFVYDDILS